MVSPTTFRSGWNSAPQASWTQWTGHLPPKSAKCGVSGGCQSFVYHDGDVRRLRPLDLPIDQRHDVLAALDVETALRVGEVVLHVDDEERRADVVCGHAAQGIPPLTSPFETSGMMIV